MIDLDAFGAALRAARERRGLRVIDLALAMGWSGTAPVYRYERGGLSAPRPDPDTVNEFARVLELDYADRMLLLGLAGHLLDTEPLTGDEEARLLAWFRPGLEHVPQPALLFDYRWRILAFNATYRRMLGITEATERAWREREVTTLDLVWDPACNTHWQVEDREYAGRMQHLRFKLYNRLRRHEAWYRAYPACRAHLRGFTAMWEHTDELLHQPLPDTDVDTVMRGEAVRLLPTGARLRFEASQRNVHGAYGLVGMLVMMPLDEPTERALAQTEPPVPAG